MVSNAGPMLAESWTEGNVGSAAGGQRREARSKRDSGLGSTARTMTHAALELSRVTKRFGQTEDQEVAALLAEAPRGAALVRA